MGGFAFHDDNSGTVDVPKFESLIYIMTHFPDIITNIRGETILDRAASSGLDKFVLIVQVAWFCISCLSRLIQHLPLTLLEVSTAAHAFCTLATYFVWRSKPLNVPEPTLLKEEEAREVYALLKCSDSEYDRALAMAMAGKEGKGDSGASQVPEASAKIILAAKALRHLPTPARPPPEPRFKEPDGILVPGHFSNKSPSKEFLLPMAAAISPILYGPIHFLAWNDNFPTSMERLLWRVSSIVVTCSGLVGVCMLFFFMMLHELYSKLGFDVFANVMSVAIIPAFHMLASGFLLVESFRQLSFLDPTAHEVPSWSNYWPHFS